MPLFFFKDMEPIELQAHWPYLHFYFKFNFSDCAELVCVLFIFQEIMRCPVSEGLRELVSWAKIYLVIWNALHS